jgi:hypothetical protein
MLYARVQRMTNQLTGSPEVVSGLRCAEHQLKAAGRRHLDKRTFSSPDKP